MRYLLLLTLLFLPVDLHAMQIYVIAGVSYTVEFDTSLTTYSYPEIAYPGCPSWQQYQAGKVIDNYGGHLSGSNCVWYRNQYVVVESPSIVPVPIDQSSIDSVSQSTLDLISSSGICSSSESPSTPSDEYARAAFAFSGIILGGLFCQAFLYNT